MASTSSCVVPSKTTYDVFLSFRGTDTRPDFISHLYAALERKSINTFIDDQLRRGEEISSALLQAIKESKISVIVFSKDYANSRWCLEELACIMECKENMGQIVLPIFYKVDPSEVRKQSGSFGEAFIGMVKEKFINNLNLVQKWRTALTKAADLSGWDSSTYRREFELVEEVAIEIKKLCPITFTAPHGLVGIGSQFEQIISLLRLDPASDDVHAVGIWGMGGIGKTTIAECIFGHIANQFDRFCFFRDVRENSEKSNEVQLLRSFYSQLLGVETSMIQTVRVLPTYISDMLRNKKVLVVLDDVNDLKQLRALLSDVPYGPRSRIIVTSRDKKVLLNGVAEDEIYEMEGLNYYNALQLLSMKAFNKMRPPKDFVELSNKIVRYAGRVPLALEVLGSHLRGMKKKEEWAAFLKDLKQFHDDDIQKILRKSYDELNEKEKEIFLDIACFFKGYHIDRVKELLDVWELPSTRGINRLIDKCLISFVDNRLRMHDLIQEMGQDIAQQEGSRLFKSKDILHVLNTNTGNKVQGIRFDTSGCKVIYLHPTTFTKMPNLRILVISQRSYVDNKIFFTLEDGQLDLDYLPNKLSVLHWVNYPYKSLPSSFSIDSLVELNMKGSNITQLWDGKKFPVNLKRLDLSMCMHLKKIPNLCNAANLEELTLFDCRSLVEIDSSISCLHRLVWLSLHSCFSLKILADIPSSIKDLDLSKSGVEEWSQSNQFPLNLENLLLDGYCKIRSFPNITGNLQRIGLHSCGIEELPSFIGCLSSLRQLTICNCENLEVLPNFICDLKSLTFLRVSGCSKLLKLPPLHGLTSLKDLYLSLNAIEEISDVVGISELKRLERLDLSGCSKLGKLPSLHGFSSLKRLNLSETALEEIPSDIGICELRCLYSLELSRCSKLRKLPNDIISQSSLKHLNISRCKSLRCLPKLPKQLKRLEVQNCTSLTTTESSLYIPYNLDMSSAVRRKAELQVKFNYLNCLSLDENARSDILAQAESNLKTTAREARTYPLIIIPGSKIPYWYEHQSQGFPFCIRFPCNIFSTLFLGFDFSVLLEFDSDFYYEDITLVCKYFFKNDDDNVKGQWSVDIIMDINDFVKSDHVVLWCQKFSQSDGCVRDWLIESKSHVIEVSFEFKALRMDCSLFSDSEVVLVCPLNIKKCGVRLMYEKDEQKKWSGSTVQTDPEEPLSDKDKRMDSALLPSSSSYVTTEPAQYMNINKRSGMNKDKEPQPNATTGLLYMFAGKENNGDLASSSSSYFHEEGKEIDAGSNRNGEHEEEEPQPKGMKDFFLKLLCCFELFMRS